MKKWHIAVILWLSACAQKEEKPWAKYEKWMNPDHLVLDSLPDTLAFTLDKYIKMHTEDTQCAALNYISANLHSKGGRLHDAATALENINTNYPSSKYAADACISAAVNYENIGMLDHAKRMYGVFINRYPNHARAAEVKQVLEMMNKGATTAEEQLEQILKNKQ